MKNTDFMNLSLPEGTDKIDVEILNNDFKKLESEASKHYIQQQIEVDGTATIIGSIGPYVQLENLTDNILNVSIGDELVVLMKGDNRKIRTVSGENYGVVTNGAVRITYYINARTYADENFYKKEKVDELLSNVEATVEVDAELSETSENPVQNKVITAELASYATTVEVESKVTEKVAEIVAGAPEDFDTLKEMSDWLTEHEDSAASMNSAIQKNTEDIATANSAIQKNTNDISNKLTYGQITLYVDSVSGSDDNVGTSSSSAFKTLQKAIGHGKLYQKYFIRLADGEYTLNNVWYIFNQEVHISGTSTENTVIKVNNTIRADNGYVDLYRCTFDTTASIADYPIMFYYGSVMRGNELRITTTRHSCLNAFCDCSIQIKGSAFVGATECSLSAVYNCELEVTDCTSETDKPDLRTSDGGTLFIWNCDLDYEIVGTYARVYKNGVQVYPVDISDTTAALKNDVATNRSALGTQCKNLLPNNLTSSNWNGVEVTKYDDGSLEMNGTMTATSTQFLPIGIINADNVLNKTLKISGINTSYQIDLRNSDGAQIAAYIKNSDYELTVTNENLSIIRIMIQATSGKVYDNVTIYPMVRYADITDNTYEPYTPSLQEQINSLLARIENLEGATTTTEGGE